MKAKVAALFAGVCCMLALAGYSTGVSQDEYDAVVKERDQALSQLQEV